MLKLIVEEIPFDEDLAVELFTKIGVGKVLEGWVVALLLLHERLSLQSRSFFSLLLVR